jgi:hypothetical protein
LSLIIPSKPQYSGVPYDSSAGELRWLSALQLQGAVWNDGDFIANVTRGTLVNPAPVGALATALAPVLNYNLFLGVVASAGAPKQDYYGVASFMATGTESLASLDFVISAPAGYLPTVLVTAVGAPAGATGFYAYLGTMPTVYWQQNIGGTTLGTTFTATNPLTNAFGPNAAPAGTSTGILGMANEASDAYFAGFPGGSASADIRSLVGASQAMAPGWDNDAFKTPVLKLQSAIIAINLLQPYYPSMDNSLQVGLNIDNTGAFIPSGTGFYIVDSTQTACATLLTRAHQNIGVELNGDVGARVLVRFNTASLVV